MRIISARLPMAAVLFALAAAPAAAQVPEGIWLVEHKAAVRLFDCKGQLCGAVVWVRNPALRTPSICNRTIIWGLQQAGGGQWTDGWFYDPEDGDTYHVQAQQVSEDEITADVYLGMPWLGRTVSLIRIAPYSLNGWCG